MTIPFNFRLLNVTSDVVAISCAVPMVIVPRPFVTVVWFAVAVRLPPIGELPVRPIGVAPLRMVRPQAENYFLAKNFRDFYF